MVDFKKRLTKKATEKQLDPVEIYETLDRASDKGELRKAQEFVLKSCEKKSLRSLLRALVHSSANFRV